MDNSTVRVLITFPVASNTTVTFESVSQLGRSLTNMEGTNGSEYQIVISSPYWTVRGVSTMLLVINVALVVEFTTNEAESIPVPAPNLELLSITIEPLFTQSIFQAPV